MVSFIEREYKEGLILVFIREVLEKAQKNDGKYTLNNISNTEELNKLLNNELFFKIYDSMVDKRLPGTNDYIINKEALIKHYMNLLKVKNNNLYNTEYQVELFEDFFHYYSKKIGEGKNIKYPNEFNFEEEDYNNIEYIKTLLLLEQKNYLKINNINSGCIIPENEQEAETYNSNIFYTNIVKEPKKHYLTFNISIIEGLLKFGILKINTIEKTVYIGNELIFKDGKDMTNGTQVRKGAYILYALLKVGTITNNSLSITDNQLDKFKIEFNNAKIILGGNSKVKLEDFGDSQLTRGTALLNKHGEKYFRINKRNCGKSTIDLLKS